MVPTIRRTPAATEVSETRQKSPIIPVFLTCVPPQSSVEEVPIFTILTLSPYFSSKRAIAPLSRAVATSVITVSQGSAARMWLFTMLSTR